MINSIECMKRALSLAQKGKYLTSPNPMVGCVITKDNKIIGEGWHEEVGKNHAEINAIESVKKRHGENYLKLLQNSIFHLTLEPCSKKGKTEACCDTLIKLKIGKVIVCSKDSSQLGIKKLTRAGIQIEEASRSLQQKAYKINQGFFSRIQKGRPFIQCKIGISSDGGVALENGHSQWITSKKSRIDVHLLRAEMDAILTGIGTILADDPQLTARGIKSINFRQPLRCVADTHCKMMGTERILNAEKDVIIFSKDKPSNLKSSIQYIKTPCKENSLDLKHVMKWLGDQKINSLLIESGPRLIDSLITEGLIDQFIFYIAPKILGKERINFFDGIRNSPKLAKIDLLIDTIEPIGKDLKILATPIYI